MTGTGAIFLGIITGTITAILLFLCKLLFKKIILPWYLSTIYNGVDIRGKWEAEKNNFKLTLELKQHAHHLTGVLTILQTENSSTTSLYVDGEVWEGHISIRARNVDKKELSFGNFLLKIESGRLLTGFYTARMFNRHDHKEIGLGVLELSFNRCS